MEKTIEKRILSQHWDPYPNNYNISKQLHDGENSFWDEHDKNLRLGGTFPS